MHFQSSTERDGWLGKREKKSVPTPLWDVWFERECFFSSAFDNSSQECTHLSSVELEARHPVGSVEANDGVFDLVTPHEHIIAHVLHLVVLVDELEHPVLSDILRKRESKRRERSARNFPKKNVDALALTHSNPPSSEAASWPISLVCLRLRLPWHQRK